MRKLDVVYFLKENIESDEIRYSLRSVDENFPHARVWFVGGQPKGLTPDMRLYVKQNAPVKWLNVRNMLKAACENSDIPEEFWLFNDDFFILDRWGGEANRYNGTLRDHIVHIEKRHGGEQSAYSTRLRQCEKLLADAGYTTYNYAIHCPMLISKEKMLKTIERFPGCPMFRSLYGNMWRKEGFDVCELDNKIADKTGQAFGEWCSTTDLSFRDGLVGDQIRFRFHEPCRYEESHAEMG